MISKQRVNSNVKILDIVNEFEIDAEEYCTGTFTHRCKCPNQDHKDGSERTN